MTSPYISDVNGARIKDSPMPAKVNALITAVDWLAYQRALAERIVALS